MPEREPMLRIGAPKCFHVGFFEARFRKDLSIMMFLDVVTAFEIALYSLIVLLFVVTGYLNMKDFQTMRQDKWTRQDSVAVMLRSLFWAFLLNFLLTVAINSGILLFPTLTVSLSSRAILPWVLTSLEVVLGVLLLTGVIFGIAKWKDWYDLIDAEY